jgi:hypothetical protein
MVVQPPPWEAARQHEHMGALATMNSAMRGSVVLVSPSGSVVLG